MNREQFFIKWSDLHGGAEIKGIVKWWLSVSYSIARVLIRISPTLLTLLALPVALLFLYYLPSPLSILLLVLTLAIDGIDGTVAILAEKVSKSGAVLDAFVDRLVESAWAYGLFLLGAPWQLVLSAWLAAFVQEYMRARAGGLGVNEVGIVTIAERPVRATLLFIGLVATMVGIADQGRIATITSVIWVVMQVIAALTIFLSLRSRLRQSQH
jgi:phosphatidylglycerophosphate synthase